METAQALAEVDRAMSDFAASATYFSGAEGKLLKQHPNKWVGIYKGDVFAVADSLDDLIARAEAKNIPTTEVLARYLERNRRTLIL